jgi:hypothetical protein
MKSKWWYIMDDPPCSGHKVYIPAEISEDGWIVTVHCLTRPIRPRLDMRVAEDRRRIELRPRCDWPTQL